jgi:hypothetical protein
MKRIGVALLFASLLAIGPGAVTTASAATHDQGEWDCAYGFCVSVKDVTGGRFIAVRINPGNATNACVQGFSWFQGTPSAFLISGRLTPNTTTSFGYAGNFYAFEDATVGLVDCSSGAKILTLLIPGNVGAGTENRFI